MSQLFVSYARENRPIIVALVRDLQQANYQTWMDDSLRGGQSWWGEIIRHIQECDVFVAMLSQYAIRSEACKRELAWALALNKPVLPVAVEMIRQQIVPARLSELHIVDYSDPTSGAFRIIGGLAAVPSAPPLPDPLPDPPAAPMSYLISLREQVTQSEPLEHRDQWDVLRLLQRALRANDPEESEDARDLLTVFRDRGDLFLDVAQELADASGSRLTRSLRPVLHDPGPDDDENELLRRSQEFGQARSQAGLERKSLRVDFDLPETRSNIHPGAATSIDRHPKARRPFGTLDELRKKLLRVSDLAEKYKDVEHQRERSRKFALLTDRLSAGAATNDELRLQNQRDATTEFDYFDVTLHSKLAVIIPDLQERVAEYESKLATTAELVDELREPRPVEGHDVNRKAKELELFWAKDVLDVLNAEIRDECKRMIELADEIRGASHGDTD